LQALKNAFMSRLEGVTSAKLPAPIPARPSRRDTSPPATAFPSPPTRTHLSWLTFLKPFMLETPARSSAFEQLCECFNLCAASGSPPAADAAPAFSASPPAPLDRRKCAKSLRHLDLEGWAGAEGGAAPDRQGERLQDAADEEALAPSSSAMPPITRPSSRSWSSCDRRRPVLSSFFVSLRLSASVGGGHISTISFHAAVVVVVAVRAGPRRLARPAAAAARPRPSSPQTFSIFSPR